MTHDPDTSLLGRTPGLAEEHFAHDGLITKHAVRAVALAALRPMPGQLLWDLGTGAGSIAVEWCRTDPTCRAIGLERKAERAANARTNASELTLPGQFDVIDADLAKGLPEGLPDPDAVFIGLGLVIIGVPLALALAIITFMAGFIPFAGAITAGALSTLIALVSLGFTEAIIVLIVVVAVQQIESNILSPWFQARAMNLHPVVVLISVITGAALFGLIGAFLAVPVAAMVAVCYRYIQDLLTLDSGERRARDITSVTIAGELAAKFTEDNGRSLRRTWRQDGSSQAHAHEDAAKYTKEAAIHLDDDLEDHLEKRIDLDARPQNNNPERHDHRLATERQDW